MDKKIIIILGVFVILGLFALVFLGEEKAEELGHTLENAENIAFEWVENNSPTYLFDGRGLEVVGSREIEEGFLFEVDLTFTSTSAGYGDRKDELTAQVMTPHNLEVVVEGEEVVSVVNDGVFNEMTNNFIEDEVDVNNEEEEEDYMEIGLYFVRVDNGQEEVVEVARTIDYTLQTARVALEELLAGPTTQEKEEGLSTSIPEGTEGLDIDIEDGVATVDFSEELHQEVAGSAWVMIIRDQIEQTLLQFDTVDEVIILIAGSDQDVLQP